MTQTEHWKPVFALKFKPACIRSEKIIPGDNLLNNKRLGSVHVVCHRYSEYL